MRAVFARHIPLLILSTLLSVGLTAAPSNAQLAEPQGDPSARVAAAGKVKLKATAKKVAVGTRVYLVGKAKARKGTRVWVQQRKLSSAQFYPEGRTKVKKKGRIRYAETIDTKDDRYYRACIAKRGRMVCSKPTFVDVVTSLPTPPTPPTPPKQTAVVAIAATTPGAIEAGQAVTVTGSTSANLAGKPIRLEAYYSDKWGQVGTAVVDGSANFAVSGVLTAAGKSVQLRVIAPETATTTYAAANAPAVTVYGWYYLSESFRYPVEGGWEDTGALAVNGTTYPNSVEMYSYSSERVVQLDLARSCTTFAATAGLTGDNQSTDQASVRLFSDSTQIYSQNPMVLTSSYPISVNVTNALRLKLGVTTLRSGDSVRVTFGDARLLCAF